MVLTFCDLFPLFVPVIYLGARETRSADLRGRSRSREGGNAGSGNQCRQSGLPFGRGTWPALIRHWRYGKFIDLSSCSSCFQALLYSLANDTGKWKLSLRRSLAQPRARLALQFEAKFGRRKITVLSLQSIARVISRAKGN